MDMEPSKLNCEQKCSEQLLELAHKFQNKQNSGWILMSIEMCLAFWWALKWVLLHFPQKYYATETRLDKNRKRKIDFISGYLTSSNQSTKKIGVQLLQFTKNIVSILNQSRCNSQYYENSQVCQMLCRWCRCVLEFKTIWHFKNKWLDYSAVKKIFR